MCINNTTRVGVDVLIIGRNSYDNRLFLKDSLHFFHLTIIKLTNTLDLYVGGIGGRVEAVEWVFTSSTWGIRVGAFKQGIVLFEVLKCQAHLATFATSIVPIFILLSRAIYELLLREG